MKKGFFKIIILAVLMALIAISTIGCGEVEESEAKELVEQLLTDAYELNEIYYGNGLKYKDDGNPNNIYKLVLETEKYRFKSDLVEKTYEVFSESYALSLIEMAFNGVQSEINQNSVQSRFMVLNEKVDELYININYEPIVDEIARYDFSTIEITKTSGTFIEATVKTTNGVSVDVTLINEDDVWRLDSGTY